MRTKTKRQERIEGRSAAVAEFDRGWRETDQAAEAHRLSILQRLELAGEPLLERIEAERQAEAQRHRAEAFAELAEIEAAETARVEVAIPKIQAAAEAVERLKQEHVKACWHHYELLNESSGKCHLAQLRQEQLLRTVRAAKPAAITQFIAWCETEAQKLAGVSPFVRSTVKPAPIVGWRSDGLDRLVWESTGETLTLRIERLTSAIGEARALIDEDLTPEELDQRLDALRDGIPDLEFRPIKGKPGYLPEPPLSQRSADESPVLYATPPIFDSKPK